MKEEGIGLTDRALDDLARRVLLDVIGQEYGDAIKELPEHDFSPAFEKKMKKLIRRADHPIRYRVAQVAACVLLASLLSGCAVLAISPEARAAFVGWIRETYETWFVYRYVGENKGNSEDISYYPAWIPDGYYETSRFDTDTYTTIIYEDNNNNIITFYYTYDADAAGIYLEQEGVDIKSVLIGNIFADLYLDEIEENANSLVWVDEKSGVLFCISANCNEEELIKIAESVEAQEIPKPQATYRPTWLPEGYSQSLVPESEDLVNVLYASDAGSTILFAYSNSASSLHLFPQGETESFKVMVNDTPADFYLDNDSTKANWLVWERPENDLIYWIAANLPMDDLIRIAESVQGVPEPQMVYQPTWIPDGYTESFVSDLSGQTIMVFEDENKGQLTFGYSKNIGYWKLYVDIENSEVRQVEVLGQKADMYLNDSIGGTKHLVWTDENTDFLFFISANLSMDNLIRIAESVQGVPKQEVP